MTMIRVSQQELERLRVLVELGDLTHLVGQPGFVFLPGDVRPPSRAPAPSHRLSGIAPAFVRWQIRLAPGEEIGR